MADVMKFRMVVEVMVATHEDAPAVKKCLKERIVAAFPTDRECDWRPELWPIDSVMKLVVKAHQVDE